MNQEETKPEKLLILDKVRWARGRIGERETRLLGKDGSLCCLGYCMAMEGVPREALLGQGEPAESYCTDGIKIVDYLVSSEEDIDDDGIDCWQHTNSSLSEKAIDINDDPKTDDGYKVAKLNELFQPVGIRVVLVDTPEEVAVMGGIPVDFGNFRFGDAK